MIPFMTEDIYQNLVRSIDKTAPESIHLCDFPKADVSTYGSRSWKTDMDEVLKIVVHGTCLQKYGQYQKPSAYRKDVCKGTDCALSEYFADIIKDELNAKAVNVYGRCTTTLPPISFKPQLKTVGPKYGKLLGIDPPAVLPTLDGKQSNG